jgi:hypothetical protein
MRIASVVLFEQSVDELSEVNEIIELRVGRFPLPRGKKSASTDCSNTTASVDRKAHWLWKIYRPLVCSTSQDIPASPRE